MIHRPGEASSAQPPGIAELDRWAVLRPYVEDGVPLARAAEQAGVPLRTAQRWLARYRTAGRAGLARSMRTDARVRKIPDQMLLLIEGLALSTPEPSVAHVHRQVTRIAAEQGWRPPSYGSVYDVVRHIDPAMATLALHGAKRYAEVYDLILRRQADAANEIWQADHTELDLWVRTPSGRPARRWRSSGRPPVRSPAVRQLTDPRR
jgi:putative transposase